MFCDWLREESHLDSSSLGYYGPQPARLNPSPATYTAPLVKQLSPAALIKGTATPDFHAVLVNATPCLSTPHHACQRHTMLVKACQSHTMLVKATPCLSKPHHACHPNTTRHTQKLTFLRLAWGGAPCSFSPCPLSVWQELGLCSP